MVSKKKSVFGSLFGSWFAAPAPAPAPVSVPAPIKRGFSVYTREGCDFCRRAKLLVAKATKGKAAHPRIVACDDALFADKAAFWRKMGAYGVRTTHRTFPMVFFNGRFIGGFTETQQKFGD